MALRIPKEATRVTKEVANEKHLGERYPNLIKVATTDEDGLRGAFTVPKIGKQIGRFYLVMIGSNGEHDYISIETLHENRMCSLAELLYIRNLFFENEDVVVQFIPSDEARVYKLNRRTALWRINRTQDNPLPSHDEIGNKRNPRIILLNK